MGREETATATSQTEAYTALSRLLPSAIKPRDGLVMEDGRNLGVPKRILAQAFVEARKLFFQNAKDEDGRALALRATRVILLFDPEHLTAANFRKRSLLALQSDDTPAAQWAYRKALQYEFCFLDSILTSPLHRQSKSPTLWHHRLWLSQLALPSNVEAVPEDAPAEFWRRELVSVCKSGERHPKNYYAWQYARSLVNRVDGMEATIDFAHVVKDWCCQHPSDTSGWSCLLFLIPKIEPLAKRTALVRQVLGYGLELRLEHEALWVLIRTIVADEALQQEAADICVALREYVTEIEDFGGSNVLIGRVRNTLTWIEKYGHSSECRRIHSD
ncbi:hypothetical protein BDU57DRAFT_554046 [Ampelomyces quisqualis]|uniref:Protein prenylyltransferase n=1 Tax=Ampelomyces quisqualis TaxID=50730 RepID=A0A6A5R315_AMPQU|nr:hypothetical protein BDU57DRAFT_554046 [Ampelomyces quisqualis]